MKIYISILLVFLSVTLALPAQKQGNIWYFGSKAGIDFSTGFPVPLTDGAIATDEGCATICDKKGKLLFYTDGISVWNRNHTVMPNGTGLLGHSSSTQSGVIVPKPGNQNIYYVFTVSDKTEANGFRYSIVDMSADGGNGDVTVKNILLFDNCTEKITAVRHVDNVGIWVIGHEWESNKFLSYLITRDGINSVENSTPGYPVTSSQGSVHTGNFFNHIGYMKSSPDGAWIACAVYEDGYFELFKYDNTTGAVSYYLTFHSPIAGAYGVEFSPDCNMLYLSAMINPSAIYQFDLTQPTPEAVLKSQYEVVISFDDFACAALQIAPDGKIYVARYSKGYVGAIRDPNVKGSGCNYTDNMVYLSGRMCKMGLPTFIQSIFNFRIKLVSNSPICEGEDLSLKSLYVYDAEYHWTGPDGFTSTDTSFTVASASVRNSGTYALTIKFPDFELYDTIDVVVNPVPRANAGPGLTMCLGDSAVFGSSVTGGSGSYDITWSPSEGLSDPKIAAPVVSPLQSTRYYLTVDDKNGCSAWDSVDVIVNIPPLVYAGADRSICRGDATVLGDSIVTGKKIETVIWQSSDGSFEGNDFKTVLTPEAGTDYFVTVTDEAGCSTSDTVHVIVNPVPAVKLGENILICSDTTVPIGNNATLGTPPFSYQWYPSGGLSDNKAQFTLANPDSTTTYVLTVTDVNNCTAADSVTIFKDLEMKPKVYLECEPDNASVNTHIHYPLMIDAPVYFFMAGFTGFEAVIRFNATVLLPENFDFEDVLFEDGYRSIRIRGDVGRDFPVKGVLRDMEFFTAAGNSTSTQVEIAEFKWFGSYCVPKTETTDGCIEIRDICGDFPVVVYPVDTVRFSILSPSPAGSEVRIMMTANVPVNTDVMVYDKIGRLMIDAGSKSFPKGTHEIAIPVIGLEPGAYFISIATNYGTRRFKTMIIK